MLSTDLFAFQITDEQLANSPSRRDGFDEQAETSLRLYGCELIQEAGILLRLPQVVMATGQVLFHRFYCKKSFKECTLEVSRAPRRPATAPARRGTRPAPAAAPILTRPRPRRSMSPLRASSWRASWRSRRRSRRARCWW
jgi:hypothetical protein